MAKITKYYGDDVRHNISEKAVDLAAEKTTALRFLQVGETYGGSNSTMTGKWIADIIGTKIVDGKEVIDSGNYRCVWQDADGKTVPSSDLSPNFLLRRGNYYSQISVEGSVREWVRDFYKTHNYRVLEKTLAEKLAEVLNEKGLILTQTGKDNSIFTEELNFFGETTSETTTETTKPQTQTQKRKKA